MAVDVGAMAVAVAVRAALARPRDLPLSAALPSPMELAIVLAGDPALEGALPALIESLAPLGIAPTHLEVVLGCAPDGTPRAAARARLREALTPARVHAHDAAHGETFAAAHLNGEPVRLDDALRECEGLVLVLASRPGAAGGALAGETIATLADAATRARVRGHERAMADALAIDLALVVEIAPRPRAWAGTGRWLLAEWFPPTERAATP